FVVYGQCVKNARQRFGKFHVHDRPDDLNNFAFIHDVLVLLPSATRPSEAQNHEWTRMDTNGLNAPGFERWPESALCDIVKLSVFISVDSCPFVVCAVSVNPSPSARRRFRAILW